MPAPDPTAGPAMLSFYISFDLSEAFCVDRPAWDQIDTQITNILQISALPTMVIASEYVVGHVPVFQNQLACLRSNIGAGIVYVMWRSQPFYLSLSPTGVPRAQYAGCSPARTTAPPPTTAPRRTRPAPTTTPAPTTMPPTTTTPPRTTVPPSRSTPRRVPRTTTPPATTTPPLTTTSTTAPLTTEPPEENTELSGPTFPTIDALEDDDEQGKPRNNFSHFMEFNNSNGSTTTRQPVSTTTGVLSTTAPAASTTPFRLSSTVPPAPTTPPRVPPAQPWRYSVSCNIALDPSSPTKRFYLPSNMPASIWQRPGYQDGIVKLLLDSLGPIQPGAVSSVTVDEMVLTNNTTVAKNLTLFSSTATLLGMLVPVNIANCLRALLTQLGSVPVVYYDKVFSIWYMPANGLEMKFNLDYERLLPDQSATINFSDAILWALEARGIPRDNVLAVSMRPGSIDVTVCLAESAAASMRRLQIEVQQQNLVVVFNNISATAGLISYAPSDPNQPRPTPRSSTNEALGIGVGVGAAVALLAALAVVGYKRRASQAFKEEDPMTWDPMSSSSPVDTEPLLADQLRNAAVINDVDKTARLIGLLTHEYLGAAPLGLDQRDASGYTALALAAKYAHADVVRLLLDAGADPHLPNSYNQTPLHLCCALVEGRSRPDACVLVAKLLTESRGKDSVGFINQRDKEGSTALFYALQNPDHAQDLVAVLVAGGADANAKDARGRTALMQAAGYGSEGLVGLLLSKTKSSIMERDCQGRTALHWAAATGSEECVAALLSTKRFPVVCIASRDGDTALHIACREGYAGIARMLLAACDPDFRPALLRATNRYGNRAFDIACTNSHLDCIDVLKSFGQDPHAWPSTEPSSAEDSGASAPSSANNTPPKESRIDRALALRAAGPAARHTLPALDFGLLPQAQSLRLADGTAFQYPPVHAHSAASSRFPAGPAVNSLHPIAATALPADALSPLDFPDELMPVFAPPAGLASAGPAAVPSSLGVQPLPCAIDALQADPGACMNLDELAALFPVDSMHPACALEPFAPLALGAASGHHADLAPHLCARPLLPPPAVTLTPATPSPYMQPLDFAEEAPQAGAVDAGLLGVGLGLGLRAGRHGFADSGSESAGSPHSEGGNSMSGSIDSGVLDTGALLPALPLSMGPLPLAALPVPPGESTPLQPGPSPPTPSRVPGSGYGSPLSASSSSKRTDLQAVPGESDEKAAQEKREKHRQYMRGWRQAERAQIEEMERKVAALSQENISLQTSLAATRAHAEAMRAAVRAKAAHRPAGVPAGGHWVPSSLHTQDAPITESVV